MNNDIALLKVECGEGSEPIVVTKGDSPKSLFVSNELITSIKLIPNHAEVELGILEFRDCVFTSKTGINFDTGNRVLKIEELRIIDSKVNGDINLNEAFVEHLSISGSKSVFKGKNRDCPTRIDGNILLNATNLGKVDLQHFIIDGSIIGESCKFTDSISITDVFINGKLNLTDTTYTADTTYTETNITSTGLRGSIRIEHCRIGQLDQREIQSTNDARRIDVYHETLDAESISVEHLFVMNSDIQGDMDLSSITVRQTIDFENTSVSGDANFTDAVLGTEEEAADAFGMEDDITSQKHSGHINMQNTEWGGKLTLDHSRFSMLDFSFSRFDGPVSFIGCSFCGPVDFLDVEFGSDFNIKHSNFLDYCYVKGARCFGYFKGWSAEFSDELRFERVCFTKKVLLSELILQSKFVIFKCTFHAPLELSEIAFKPQTKQPSNIRCEFSMQDCLCHEHFDLSGADFRETESVRIDSVEFRQDVDFDAIQFREDSLTMQSIKGCNIRMPQIKELKKSFNCIPIGLAIKFRFSRLIKNIFTMFGQNNRKHHKDNAAVFQLLKSVFQKTERKTDEDWAYYHYLKEKNWLNINDFRKHPTTIIPTLLAVLWRISCGFGLKLWYIVMSSLLVVLVSANIFYHCSYDLILSDEATRRICSDMTAVTTQDSIAELTHETQMLSYTTKHITRTHAIMHSLDTFTGTNLGETFAAVNSPLRWLNIIEGFIGLLLITVFVGASMRKILRI